MNFKKSWDIYFQKFLDHDDFWKFMEHEFQNFNEICFSVCYILVIKSVKKHLLFLFKVYYSPMVDYCTKRRNFKRNFDNILFRGFFFLNFIEVL